MQWRYIALSRLALQQITTSPIYILSVFYIIASYRYETLMTLKVEMLKIDFKRSMNENWEAIGSILENIWLSIVSSLD